MERCVLQKLIVFLRRETVLSIAWLLAAATAFLVPPDRAYLDYIDGGTLGLLFSLMAVMAGFQGLGLFRRLGEHLLERTATTRQLEGALIFLPFFFSMAVTNDVALITFVPFAMEVLELAGEEERLIPVVAMQTIAANLGSMATPIGNPQNLYLYSHYQMSLGEFFRSMLPLTAASGLLILLFLLCRRSTPLSLPKLTPPAISEGRRLGFYLILFVLCLAAVAKALPVALLCVLVALLTALVDRRVLVRVDWSLLATFVGFFLFVGNLSRLPACHDFFQAVLAHHEAVCAVLASQALSNVPAALLLSGFTDNGTALLVGTNLGGLGTLIASMASLISYKQVVRRSPHKKGKYLLWFTAANLVFLTILLGGYLLLAV